VLTIFLTLELKGQSGGIEPAGRVEQIEAQRQEKERNLRSVHPTETTLTRIGHFMERIPVGFQVDGLGPGAGLAADSLLQKNTYNNRVVFRVWGTAWLHGFYRTGTGVEFRNFAADDLTLDLEGSHADAPQLEYYGPGPDSSIHNQTNFRREDTLFNFRVALRTHRSLSEACRLGQRLLNVGPGTNDDLATTRSVFGPAEAPGIDVQSNYFIGGCSLQLDLLDFPKDPHKGTYAEAAFDRYHAEGHDLYSFYRLSLVGEEYVPFFNRKRVIALRAQTDFSFHSADQVVPFYLQPTLGSDTELRGFPRYRFYDENAIALTAEYRWEIGTGFDMALFADGGNVFHDPGDLSLSRLKSSVGFGFRGKNQSERRPIARLDIGFSREGFQVWLRVPKVF
jgi:hypothetical protein